MMLAVITPAAARTLQALTNHLAVPMGLLGSGYESSGVPQPQSRERCRQPEYE